MRSLGLAIVLFAGVASAAPDVSKRPVGRAGTDARDPVSASVAGRVEPVAKPRTARKSSRPALRPRVLEKRAATRRAQRRKGQVCGDIALQGDVIGTVPGRIQGCGIEDAVRLRSVSGVALSQPAVMDCRTAKALKRWTEKGPKRALRKAGGGLVGYRVAAHYSCRTRNNRPGARISEHGKGRAIDISAFTLKNGSTLTVLDDWTSRNRKALKAIHRAACGPFGTVLGPNADKYHRDHFHFDTARYRSGTYCR
jgi:hypothetical protein